MKHANHAQGKYTTRAIDAARPCASAIMQNMVDSVGHLSEARILAYRSGGCLEALLQRAQQQLEELLAVLHALSSQPCLSHLASIFAGTSVLAGNKQIRWLPR